jgi:hypothetical protein
MVNLFNTPNKIKYFEFIFEYYLVFNSRKRELQWKNEEN